MFLVAIGGVIGSLFRFLLGNLFPANGAGTLWTNLIGVFIASHVVVFVERKGNANLRHLLLPGFCGGLTTFSALMLATANYGFRYLIGTTVVSLILVSISVPLARKAFHE